MKLYMAMERENTLLKIGYSTNPPSYMKHLRWKYGMDFRLICSYPISHTLLQYDYGVRAFIEYWLNDCHIKVSNKMGNAARSIYSLRCFPVQKMYEYLSRNTFIAISNDDLPRCNSCGSVFNFEANRLSSLIDLEIHLSTNSYCSRACLNKGHERIGTIEECNICHEEFTIVHVNQLLCSTKCESTYNKRKAIIPSEEDKKRRNKRTWQI